MHQRQFLPFADGGAPSIRSLASSADSRVVTVTTDRSVSVLRFDGAAYSLQSLALEGVGEDAHVVAAAGITKRPETHSGNDTAIVAVAVVQDEKFSLCVVSGADTKARPAKREQSSFELPAAPAAMVSMRATSGAGELFTGVVLFCTDVMLAFGFIGDASHDSTSECTRLSSEQFATFFPDFSMFVHPVLSMDSLLLPASDTSWIAFGCADGFVRVLSGRVQDNCSCGPYVTWDFQIDGPVTAVSLFATEKQQQGDARHESSSERLECNLLATCAIGHALVVEDVFGSATKELLEGSDQFDSIFAGVAADIDLNGRVELLLGTDDQELLVYKRSTPVANERSAEDARSDVSKQVAAGDVVFAQDKQAVEPEEVVAVDAVEVEELLASTEDQDPTANMFESAPVQAPAILEPGALQTPEKVENSMVAAPNWALMPRSQWHVHVFGAIYSLAWVDVNHDGVNELLVASSTGLFVFEADVGRVLQKVQALLSRVAAAELEKSGEA